MTLVLLLVPSAGARGPSQKARDLMRRGIVAYEEARFDEGVELLTQAIDLHPRWKTASAFRATLKNTS